MTTIHPICYKRGCVNFRGAVGDYKPVCLAFPLGIPDDILSGADPHITPMDGDGGIIFQVAKIEKELPINRAGMKALAQVRLELFNQEANRLAEQVYTGAMSVGQWEEAMRALSKDIHTGLAAIMNGGWNSMDAKLWGKLGTPLRKQYKYLHGFAEHIAANRETLSLGALQARARMYGQAALAPATAMATPVDIIQQLPWMPKDGTTECLVNCKCVWVLTTSKTRRKQTVTAVWRLSKAEHCDTCVDRNGYKVTFEVPLNVVVPSYIGGI